MRWWCQLCWIASSLKHSLWVEILFHPDFKPRSSYSSTHSAPTLSVSLLIIPQHHLSMYSKLHVPPRYFIFRKFYKHHAHTVSPTFISLLISQINPWNFHILFQIKLSTQWYAFVIFSPCFSIKFYVIFTNFMYIISTIHYSLLNLLE